MLVRVVAPHFVAGFIVEDGHVVQAADIIRYMEWRRWSVDRARDYIRRKGWKATIVKEARDEAE